MSDKHIDYGQQWREHEEGWIWDCVEPPLSCPVMHVEDSELRRHLIAVHNTWQTQRQKVCLPLCVAAVAAGHDFQCEQCGYRVQFAKDAEQLQRRAYLVDRGKSSPVSDD